MGFMGLIGAGSGTVGGCNNARNSFIDSFGVQLALWQSLVETGYAMPRHKWNE